MDAKPKLLVQVRHKLRARRCSYRTEQQYVAWVRCFILHYDKRHPREMSGLEVEAFLTHLYGSGLRLIKALQLRVKDLDFEYAQIVVRNGKGRKDRVTVLPEPMVRPLRSHLFLTRERHEAALRCAHAGTELPTLVGRLAPRRPPTVQMVFSPCPNRLRIILP